MSIRCFLEDNVQPTTIVPVAHTADFGRLAALPKERTTPRLENCHHQTADSTVLVTEQAEAKCCSLASLLDDQARPQAISDLFVHGASGDAELRARQSLPTEASYRAYAIPDSSPNARCRPSHNRDISAWRPAADGSTMSPGHQ